MVVTPAEKKYLTKKTSLKNFRYSLFAIIISLCLIPLTTLNAQVVIKEKVEIIPQTITRPEGSISGDNRNPAYLRFGGEVYIDFVHRSNWHLELWEEQLGQITLGSLGVFPQWHKFIFYLYDENTGIKYYPQPGDIVINEYGGTIDFYPSLLPGDPYPYNPEDWFMIEIDIDDFQAAMAPAEILEYYGNPFIPSPLLEIPVDCSVYAVVTYANTQISQLWLNHPSTELLLSDVSAGVLDTIYLGSKSAGEQIRFNIVSDRSVVNSSSLYPRGEYDEMYMPDGKIRLWKLEFEDWTDLYYDNIKLEIYIDPDNPEISPLEVTADPAEIAQGDTTLLIIKRKYLDGRIEDFSETATFEVGMLDGCLLGKIHAEGTDTNYIYGVTQPIYFVADSSADSGTVKLRVGIINEMIILTRSSGSGAEDALEGGIQPDNPVNEYCFFEFYQSPQFKDVDVLVKKDGCDEWACQAGFNKYKGNIEIQEVRENYSNINYCSFSLANVWPPAAGIFKPLFDEEYPNSISEKIKDQLIVNYSLNVCFDSNNGYWKYQIPENVILLRSILDVCEDNILSGTAQYLIHNLNELSIIPDEEVCLALENFEDQRLYGGGGKYYLIAPVWAHEKVHKANFEKLVNEVLNIKKKHLGSEYRYKDLLANVFQPECNETTNSESKAQFRINKHLNDILSSFIIELKERYDIAKADKDNEITTQNHPDVQWKITEYKKALQNNRLKNLWKDCSYKEKDF